MSTTFVTGDLFTTPDLDALAHGVNCKGAMGAGIAVEFKKRWPEMARKYRTQCYGNTRGGPLKPGGFYAWRSPDGLWILNLATQDKPGPFATLRWIESSLTLALGQFNERTIGLPRIGCGIGGLAWDQVRDLLSFIGDKTSNHLVVVSRPGDPEA